MWFWGYTIHTQLDSCVLKRMEKWSNSPGGNTLTIPDCIERIEILPVSRERVWDAITKPEQFSQWFDIVRDIDFRVGGTINFTWENELSPYPAVIEKIEPLHCFAFRWASRAMSHPHLKLPPTATTLVTFTIEE